VHAALVTSLGEPPAPADVDEPGPREGEEVVAVEAVALNPLDLSVARGTFYGGHPPLPYPPGCEAAGRLADGTRVYLFGAGRGTAAPGFLAERVAVPADLPLRLPAGTDPVTAAGIGIAGVAGWVAVAWRARVAPGDRVLVLGATGTVGRVALQAARALGARTVVGASRTPAEGVVSLEGIGEAFGGDGFTVCIDPLWGEPLARALAFAAPGARVVHLGQSAGAEAPLRSADVRGKQLEILGHSNFGLAPGERNRAYLELLERVRAGAITLEVEPYPLDRVGEAWERQGAPGRGKVVVTLP
jgi:NADPH:quinone reductase-like Zn-dependent oxidoreductase